MAREARERTWRTWTQNSEKRFLDTSLGELWAFKITESLKMVYLGMSHEQQDRKQLMDQLLSHGDWALGPPDSWNTLWETRKKTSGWRNRAEQTYSFLLFHESLILIFWSILRPGIQSETCICHCKLLTGMKVPEHTPQNHGALRCLHRRLLSEFMNANPGYSPVWGNLVK